MIFCNQRNSASSADLFFSRWSIRSFMSFIKLFPSRTVLQIFILSYNLRIYLYGMSSLPADALDVLFFDVVSFSRSVPQQYILPPEVVISHVRGGALFPLFRSVCLWAELFIPI